MEADDPGAPAELMLPLAAGPLRLEPLVLAHADEMYPLLAEPALYQYMDHAPPPSLAHLQGVYGRLQARGPGDGSGEVWLNWIIRAPDGTAAGVVQSTIVSADTAWVAYVLGSHCRGRGWARMAAAAMVAHLQQHWGMRRFLAMVEAEHVRSVRLLEALGFVPASAELSAEQGTGPTERLLVWHVPACISDSAA